MRSGRAAFGLLVCAVSAVACSKQSAPNGDHRVNLAQAHAPQRCPLGLQAQDAVVIDITDVNQLDPAHVTQWHEKTNASGSGPDNVHIPPPLVPMPSGHTAADVDARPFLKNPSDLLLLQINIPTTSALTFAPNAIQVDDAHGGKMFCVDQPISGGGYSVIFYTRYFKERYGYYTMIFSDGKGQLVRIAIDPEVQNNG